MTPQLSDIGDSQACNTALAELQRALKALSFYPENHPLRDEILHKAFQAVSVVANNGGLSLIIRRNGLSFAGREVVVENNPMNSSLAKELFVREVQQLTLLPDLTFSDFIGFLSLLAMEPPQVIAAGGVADLLAEKGIHSVLANEIDITKVFTKKTTGAPSEETQSEAGNNDDQIVEWDDEEFQQEGIESSDQLSELDADELLARMETEKEDDTYRLLARHLSSKGEELKGSKDFDRLFKVILQLLKQNDDGRKSIVKREIALSLFRQLSLGSMAEHLLDHLEDENFKKKELLLSIIGKLGGDIADPLIERLLAAGEQTASRELTAALVKCGPAAVPSLLGKLKVNDLQTVRSAVVLLGELGCKEAVGDLMGMARHDDGRLCMEAIRSLARIGGREATTMLLDLLDDKNPSVRRQTVTSLGVTRNDRALERLLQIATMIDFLGKNHSLKKEAILAVGRIGDRQAFDPLCNMVRKRRFITTTRGEEIKIAAIDAIAQLGGESSREFLEETAAMGGRIGRACHSALRSLERLAKRGEEAEMGTQ